MSHHLITFDKVSYQYSDGTQALNKVGFQIHHGEKIGLLGSNGAGKSTLISILCGFLSPAEGAVYLGDLSINENSLTTVRRTLGVVFQNPDDQLFMPTVYDDIAFGLEELGVCAMDIEARVDAALIKVDALAIKHKPPFRLSLGQKKLAAIAGVIAMEPQVLVLDEPTASLDPLAREKIISLMLSFSHSQLIATHDLDMVLAVCDRVIVLHQGAVVAATTPEALFADEQTVRKYGLALPLSMQQISRPAKKTLIA